MNASETAFCWPLVEDSNLNRSEPQYAIRYFTPTQEVPLCGHATLASAFALLHLQAGRQPDKTKDIPFTSVTFIAKGGMLKCQAIGERTVVMDFPAAPPEMVPLLASYAALLGDSQRHPLAVARRGDWLLLELASVQQVREAQPDLVTLVKDGHGHLILTAKSDTAEYDIVSRVFAPGAGIPEDPVTGFAHTLLAPYWQDRLGKVDASGRVVSRSQLRCYQASRRGGSLRAKCVGDRVVLEGEAVLAFEAELAGGAVLGA